MREFKQREIIVARLSKEAKIVRFIDESSGLAKVAIGRNKQAKLPRDRIIFATGLVTDDMDLVDRFRVEAVDIAVTLDLVPVWKLVEEDRSKLSLQEISELCFEGSPTPVQITAVALHLDNDDKLFVYKADGYFSRTPAEVDEIQRKLRRQTEVAERATTLMEALERGLLPATMSEDHVQMIEHLKQFVIYGDEYARSHVAHSLLGKVTVGNSNLEKRAFDLLVGAGVFSEDEPLELHRAEIEESFDIGVLGEARSIKLPANIEQSKRLDLTHLEVFTIDNADTSDRDDGISLEILDQGYRIGIHIADAGALIPMGGPMDIEADRRMASLYLPEGTINMLPTDFIVQIGSIDPGENRYAVSVLVVVGPTGDVEGYEVVRSIVRSRSAISYEEADNAIGNPVSNMHKTMVSLNSIAQVLGGKREERGAININRSEMEVSLDDSGDPKVAVRNRTTPGQTLVAEMMILCNSLLADFCTLHGIPVGYRSQPPLDLSTLDPTATDKLASPFDRFLITRSLAPAGVSVIPSPHAGLGVSAYIQATSPLRRYPDLVMQRQIGHHILTGNVPYEVANIGVIAQRGEEQLREINRIEEARKRYWFLKYLMQTRLGTDFIATVLENEPHRYALVELDEYPFRARVELPKLLDPSSDVRLKLVGVDLWRRQAQFIHQPR